MVSVSWLPPFFVQASERLIGTFGEFAGGATVWLAVTGLSRSGKTVFITSLIHNLLSALHNPHRMPLLSVINQGRLIAASLEGAKAQRLPRFPYFKNIEKMTGPLPDWPAGTTDISELGVEIRFTPANTVGKILSEITGTPAGLTVRIVDYPGEWLLDLPLLEHSYAEWSAATLPMLRSGARAQIAGDFLSFIGQHSADEPASEEVAKQAHDLYRALLLRARDQYGLSYLQPGRFLCQGSLADAPYLWFAPLDLRREGAPIAPSTLGALMAERFEVYKREVIGPFYEDSFRHYSRQIALVDVLRALLAGQEAFEDTRLALAAMIKSFRYGHGSILAKILRGRHIDR